MRSPIAASLAALALIVQLFVIPFHHMPTPPNGADVVAELKATIGASVVLCQQAEDGSGSQTPSAPAGHCDDQCPLCQFQASGAALILPEPAALPAKIEATAEILVVPTTRIVINPRGAAYAQPRAPPIEA